MATTKPLVHAELNADVPVIVDRRSRARGGARA